MQYLLLQVAKLNDVRLCIRRDEGGLDGRAMHSSDAVAKSSLDACHDCLPKE